MELETAIERLSNAVYQGTGASAAAATVLLFGWNSMQPMRDLLSLDLKNRAAALIVIEAAFKNRLNGGSVMEKIAGYEDIRSLNKIYGVNGSTWKS
jgi:hypothetical protein